MPAFQMQVEQTMGTAMFNVASHNHPEIISYFLNQDFEITDGLIAAAGGNGTSEVVEVLLDHGWDIIDGTGRGVHL